MANHKPLVYEASGETDIVMARDFDAPRDLVWDAWTVPDLVKRWYGPPGWSLAVCEIDLRPEGAYRFEMANDGGHARGWGGVFREVERPEHYVQTEVADEPWFEGECVQTHRFREADGVTTFEATMTYASREIRDMVLAAPMSEGYARSFDRLDDLLANE